MTPKTNSENCVPGHCDDHGGLLAWMKGIAALLTISSVLLGYSVIWQAPNIRMEIVKEIARLDLKDAATDYRMQTIEKDVKNIMTLLEK